MAASMPFFLMSSKMGPNLKHDHKKQFLNARGAPRNELETHDVGYYRKPQTHSQHQLQTKDSASDSKDLTLSWTGVSPLESLVL